MIVLGIADNHDSGAALVVDGELVAAVNQERVDREKGSGAFPWGAIDAVLDLGGVNTRDLPGISRFKLGTGGQAITLAGTYF
jgi:carbamoyltransferase